MWKYKDSEKVIDMHQAVIDFCNELIENDPWMWEEPCVYILHHFNWSSPAAFVGKGNDYTIYGKMKNGKEVELARTDTGHSIKWGKPPKEEE
jgi:hypothetical protein